MDHKNTAGQSRSEKHQRIISLPVKVFIKNSPKHLTVLEGSAGEFCFFPRGPHSRSFRMKGGKRAEKPENIMKHVVKDFQVP